MNIHIENLLGIKWADIPLDGIVEVVGPNASGKTSIAVVAQALLSQNANPLGLPANQTRNTYGHGGDREGYAETDGVTWRPGQGGITVDMGVEPASRPEAVGLVDYTARRGDKERLAWLQSALLPDDATILERIKEELTKYLPPQDLTGVCEQVEKRGVEAAEGIYADRNREAKRQWKDATGGQTYGVKVAADWRPRGWLADMDSMTVGEADEAVTAAREQLSLLHQVQAVSEAEAEAAAAALADLPSLRLHLDDALDALSKAQGALAAMPLRETERDINAIQETMHNLRYHLTLPDFVPCPHCGGKVVLGPDDDDIRPYDEEKDGVLRSEQHARLKDLEAELADRMEILGQQQEAVKAAEFQAGLAAQRRDGARTAVAVAEQAAKKADAQVDSEERRANLAQAEQAVDDARKTAEMVRAEATASELAQTIVRYSEIVRVLGPQGVKAKMMDSGLKTLNAGLRAVSRESGWPTVEVRANGTVYSGCGLAGGGVDATYWAGRPVALCSESERWRAQAAIQLTLAAITGSKAAVLDRADLLDPANREGLVKAVNRVAGKTGMAVLLCSTGEPDGAAPWRQITVEGGVTA